MSTRALALAMLALAAGGCGDRTPASRWPMHEANGPLALVVRHPVAGDPLPASGRDYVMGSTGNGRARVTVNGEPVTVHPDGGFNAYLPASAAGYRVSARVGDDSARVAIPVGAAPVATPASSSGAPARGAVRIVSAGASEIPARDEPAGDYSWFLLPGTRAEVTGTQGSLRKLRFAGGATAWIDGQFVVPARGPAPRLTTSVVRVEAHGGETDIVIPAPAPLAYQVEEGASSIAITVHGVRAAAARPAATGYVAQVAVGTGDSAAVHVGATLRGPAYGYEVVWSRGAMVLRLRHPPAIDSLRPLAGLAIVVDAGHPPGGAVGPTGLAEPVVTLDVARRLATLLAARGARVILTRPDAGAVSLDRRVALTRASGAHAFVSVHADAIASGADPAHDNGTAVYAYRAQSRALAGEVQRALVERLGLPDRGVRTGDFAVIRNPWLPAVLCEGATLTVPAQEAALADATFRAEYAAGIADGLEAYFADLRTASHTR